MRNRDPDTLAGDGGCLNIPLGSLPGGGTGGVAADRDVLSERDPSTLAARAHALAAAEGTAIRSLFGSFGTCSVTRLEGTS